LKKDAEGYYLDHALGTT